MEAPRHGPALPLHRSHPVQEALLGFTADGVTVVIDVDPYQMM